MFRPLPSVSDLWEAFELNPLTGELYWRIRPANCIQIGDKAGWLDRRYIVVRFQRNNHFIHRLIYKWVTGNEPPHLVEHRDDNKLNNQPWNLLASNDRANRISFLANAGTPVRGYSPRCKNKFYARIRIKGKSIHLGSFDTPEEAHAAYLQALSTYDISPPHPN